MTSPSPSISPPNDPNVPTSKPTKFRFKSKPSSKHQRDESPASEPPSSSSRRHKSAHHSRHHHHHHHHRRRRSQHSKPSPPDDPTLYDDTYLPNATSEKYLDPDTAFRESLFDALADDEGAAFWEGVYGQPIHTYSAYRPNSGAAKSDDGECLERMDDEEYTAYVRAKMWEKSHGYMLEERAKREEARAKRKEWEAEEGQRRREGRKTNDFWSRGVEDGMRRREQRNGSDQWKGIWEAYLKSWEKLKAKVEEESSRSSDATNEDAKVERKGRGIRDEIAWPVRSGKFKDVETAAIEEFLRHAPQSVRTAEEVDLPGILKIERVRWHPDKIQQRFGSLGIDERTMKAVTAVFQVIDRTLSQERVKSGG